MNAYQKVLRRAYEGRIPFQAHIELTYRCNLRCVHCYATRRDGGGELRAEEVEDVLRQLAAMGALFVVFTGGEVFCRPDAVRILRAAREMDFAIQVFTNGTLVTDAVADDLAAVEPLGVEVSLYGARPETHDRITGVPGSWERTVAGARRCVARGLNTTVKTMLLRENAGEYDLLRTLAEELGARFVFDFVLAPADTGTRPMSEHGLPEAGMYAFLKERVRAGRPRRAPAADQPLCGAGANTLCVNPRGDVYPCLALRRAVGNVRERSLARIWSSGAILDNLRGTCYGNLVDCRNCQEAAYCGYCPGIAWAETGDMLRPYASACAVGRATRRAAESARKRRTVHGEKRA